ncbi:DUF7660 family protein [Domibacillus robiginosus]
MEAMKARITDMDGYYESTDQPTRKHPSWKFIAVMRCLKEYE